MSIQQVDWGDGTAIYSGPLGQTVPDHTYATNGVKNLIARVVEADGTTEAARTTGSMTVPPGTLQSMTPNTGPAAGGTPVSLIGTGLTGTTMVYFGGQAATDVVIVNPGLVTCVSPAGTPEALVNVNAMVRAVATNPTQFQYGAAAEEPPDEEGPVAPVTTRGARRRGR